MGSLFMNFDDLIGAVGKKRDRKATQSISASELAYKAQADKLALEQKDRELALSRVDMQHNWEGQAATRDSTLAQLAQAQAKSARLAAVGAAFAKSQGKQYSDAGGEAQKRLMGLLGNVNSYQEQAYNFGKATR